MQTAKLLKTGIPVILFLIIAGNWYNAFTSANGPTARNTGAPGESDCTSCHNSSSLVSNSNDITLTSNGGTLFEYLPDSTYTITINMSQSGINKFGFQVTALRASNNTFAGTFTITNSSRTQ